MRASDAAAFRMVALRIPEVRAARSVAAYRSVGSEPPTTPLLDALRERGARVLLPVLLPDGDLDWAEYAGRDSLAAGARGLVEPTGVRLGPEAVAGVDVALVPGLAVDLDGRRLGRGGGSYDRALARIPSGRFTAVLLYDEDVLSAVPAAAHDRPVSAAITPTRVIRFPATT